MTPTDYIQPWFGLDFKLITGPESLGFKTGEITLHTLRLQHKSIPCMKRVGEGKKGKGEGTVLNIGWKVLKKIAENLKG